jgi:hypothetical protein
MDGLDERDVYVDEKEDMEKVEEVGEGFGRGAASPGLGSSWSWERMGRHFGFGRSLIEMI